MPSIRDIMAFADSPPPPGASPWAWLPPLERAGFTLVIREPWWDGHRGLRWDGCESNIHVFGPEAPEPWRHRIFRDHLRRDAEDRTRYATVKREAADAANAGRETVMQYNVRKQAVIRAIYAKAFEAAGLVS
ncbi:hypothetical protein B5M43_011270 [Microbacterium sp. MEC084]|jgi:GrpB-like predicted nucleotidyltransferase (UPF0157 family)|uniref:GrpB family protein n=1 Tax=unclassified Microbacterium TaxID=2609290 RepID=UPI0006F52339|nr:MULTISPECIES: GrpB family protein [unclassified Microbacterium]KQZ11712.1 hypothetical protein ASD19_00015 [Microbacterium sp. Root53]MCD1269411.1 hypothetical protein [Microbacterium sp. MEC084]